MTVPASAGARLRAALADERPLQVVGAINAYHAHAGRARRLQGDLPLRRRRGGGLPRPAGPRHHQPGRRARGRAPHHRCHATCRCWWTSTPAWARRLQHRAHRRATDQAPAPPACTSRTRCGAKRCGHRPARRSCRKEEMVDRIKAAVDARTDADFVIMARTDALAVEGLEAAIDRACACVEAGADMIFPEAMTDARQVPPVRRRGEGAGAGQHHRVRRDAAVHRRGARERRRRAGAVSAVGLPRHEQGRARTSTGDPPRRHAEERASTRCRPATSCTTTWATTTSSRSWTRCSPRRRE